ncbi:hypothetical protein M446_5710 [Methylobacterium sp. 4-46]|uniref:hypothetical protein n=1 Tax=unclassified Methylobacterium TaxID=2615210 RepID=UPI000152EA69|nr:MULTISPECIES: hypothetical protein [Methylobacterium]ACA20000.1 hypothetical protein M446_5710 [Methylobacterium sp. 4-46]WFT79185.1 hypothetical protein QA634_28815 [Methylobacterium nodulans]
MKTLVLTSLGALALGAGALLGSSSARAMGDGYDAFDVPRTVVTRRTIVERRVIAPPPRVVREVVVERPVIRPRPVLREVVVERPVVYRPRPVVDEVVVERYGAYGPRRFGPGPVGFGPADDPADW